MIVHFDPAICTECNQKERCPSKIGVRVSTLDIDEPMLVGATRHTNIVNNVESMLARK